MVYTLGIAFVIVIGTLWLYTMSLQMGQNLNYARTMAFVGLGFFMIYNAYSSRSLEKSVLRMNPFSNKTLLLGIAGSILSILVVVYIPFMQSIFETEPLTPQSWMLVLVAGLPVILAAAIMKKFLPGLR